MININWNCNHSSL